MLSTASTERAEVLPSMPFSEAELHELRSWLDRLSANHPDPYCAIACSRTRLIFWAPAGQARALAPAIAEAAMCHLGRRFEYTVA